MEEKIIVKSEKFQLGKIFAILTVSAFAIYVVWGILENLGLDLTDLSKIDVWRFGFWGVVALIAILGIIYLWLRSYEMTVTDKRVFGKVAWGKRVDLPLDSISSTATISLFKGVAVATSSGRIKFLMVKNSAEIFEKVNALLIERQKSKNETTPVQSASTAASNADELKKFKELLDQGIITQEEFDAKKKELLGL